MMIKAELRRSEQLPCGRSYFVTFPFRLVFVEKVKRIPHRRYNPDTKEWEIPETALPMLEKVFDGVKIDVVVGSDIEDVKTIYTKTPPYNHQKIGVEFGLKNNAILIADEQGLGKTKQAIDIAVNRKINNGVKRCLIITGVAGLKYNWAREIAAHSDEKALILGLRQTATGRVRESSATKLEDLKSLRERDEFFVITNIESIRSKKSKTGGERNEILVELTKLIKAGEIGMAIIDEVHKAKNPRSQQGKAIHNINPPYKVALTGTPVMNNPLDVYNIMKWLGAEHGSFWSFRNRYAVMGGFGGHEVVGFKNLQNLKSRLDLVMIRRKKSEVLDLPPKIYTVDLVEMSEKQAQLYREVELYIQSMADEIMISPNPLGQLTRLRQATSCPALLTSQAVPSAKLERLRDIVEDVTSSGGKLVVYSVFEQAVRHLVEELRAYNPAVITGSIPTVERSRRILEFQNDNRTKLLIGTVGALGTGYNLTAAQTVVFLDKPWTPADAQQAEDRCHRIGTAGTVNIITLVCKNTLDERIEAIIYNKDAYAKYLVDGEMTTNKALVQALIGK